jgi:hypothetical protein
MHCISLLCSTHCIAYLVYEGACGCRLAVQPSTSEKHTKHQQALTAAHHPGHRTDAEHCCSQHTTDVSTGHQWHTDGPWMLTTTLPGPHQTDFTSRGTRRR